ncbi:MAG TPA: glycerol-3-phosphate dehydrogenase/oxidase [Actinomycetota bacterium]|nr:glycerol-3-phosphate dehydrogenase/oxidase [Actinomycetota bacterium]
MGGLGSRTSALERLGATATGDPLDLLVVGGGITGAGIALDAAARGMSVGLVERMDFASGTSSKSSKLVHGGLRYLEQREFGLMREACTERDLLRRLAPHLVEPIPFVLPVSHRSARAKFGVGLWAYDALASFKNLKVHKHLDGPEVDQLVPALPPGKVRGGYVFYDCKTDDVRLVMEVLVQAVRYGAIAVNHACVRDLNSGASGCSALVEDVETSQLIDVRARRIVVAAGVWADRLEALAKDGSEPRLRPSKGVHLVFRKDQVPVTDAAAFIPDVSRKRMLFVIPWLDHVLVGTTDTSYSGPLDHPSVDAEDRAYCLDSVNAIFGLGLTENDVAGAYAGLRPLIAGKKGSTADLSRRHAVYEIEPGILGITGGKLTTYRRMAADAVDRIAGDLGNQSRCRTKWIRLGSSDPERLRVAVDRRARKLGVPSEVVTDLIRRYGDRSLEVLDVGAAEDLLSPLVPGETPVAAEALYCAREEMALHLDDLLSRRTRLSLLDPAAGIGNGSRAPELMAGAFGWTKAAQARAVESHRMTIENERGLPLRPAAVPPAPDIRSSDLGAG